MHSLVLFEARKIMATFPVAAMGAAECHSSLRQAQLRDPTVSGPAFPTTSNALLQDLPQEIRLHSESTDSDDRLASANRPASPTDTTTSERPVPDWILTMLATQFFGACPIHRDFKKNECTYFCVQCNDARSGLCQHCVNAHARSHVLIQIRRYVYCDVVRVQDIQKFMDTSGIQSYVINQAKVVFLRNRSQPKQPRSGKNDICLNCSRGLRETCRYCSLGCKVSHLAKGGSDSVPSSPHREVHRRLQEIQLAGSPGKRPRSATSAASAEVPKMKAGQSGLHIFSMRKHLRKQLLPTRSPAF